MGAAPMESSYFDREHINRAVKSGHHRETVGGLWDEIGRLQYQFLVGHGLRPSHTLLDIGCGCLRAGIFLIRYLEAANYFGVDLNQSLLDAGFEIELKESGLQHKLPRKNLLCLAEFEFEPLGRRVDFALAHSLFTHLTFNRIRRCLERMIPVINIGGSLFTTFFELPETEAFSHPYTHDPGGVVTYDTSDPYHYKVSDFFHATTGLPWQIRYIGEWQHPRAQRMLEFIRI
jgi:hypothetical protein